MKILNECSFLDEKKISIIENHYNAKYVFETSLKDDGGYWVLHNAAVFYTKEPHPQGSNYFAFYMSKQNKYMIRDALPLVEEPFEGICIDDEVVYSRNRHDYRVHNGIFVDGGRDYLRFGGKRFSEAKMVKLKVVDDHLEIIS